MHIQNHGEVAGRGFLRRIGTDSESQNDTLKQSNTSTREKIFRLTKGFAGVEGRFSG